MCTRTAALSKTFILSRNLVDPAPSQASQSSISNNAYSLFQSVDINKKYVALFKIQIYSGFLDCQELQAALSSGGISFSLQTVNILLAKHDRERKYFSVFGFYSSGQLGFEEFKSLLDEVWKWKVVFRPFESLVECLRFFR